MTAFAAIWDRAVARHGEDDLRARFPEVVSDAALRKLGDDRYLSAMTHRVFGAGFVMRVIDAKWKGFEEAFHGFDPAWVADVDAEGFEALRQDKRIVRNPQKIKATIANGAFVRQIAAEHGGFGKWLAAWPLSDTVGLWRFLENNGSRLGGDTGRWFLRSVGRDTFRISEDGVKALIEAGVVTKAPTSQKDLAKVQEAYTAWAAETGLSLGAISVVLACSTGEVYPH